MKKFIVIVLIALVCSCASNSKSKTDQLDTVIRETSDYFNNNLTKGNKLAIINIQSEYPTLSEYIIDELVANTVNDKIFSIVDRKQLDTIRAEQNFQMSGEVDETSAQKLGAMLGAQTIITGGITKIGDMYRLRVSAISVESAQVEGQFNKNIPSGPTIDMLAQGGASGGGSGNTRNTQTAAQTRQAQNAGKTVTVTGLTAAGYNGKYGMIALGDGRNTICLSEIISLNADSITFSLQTPQKRPFTGNGNYIAAVFIFENKNDDQAIWVGRVTSKAINTPDTNIPFTEFTIVPIAQSYKIGDTGPAGGIIFYDKRSNSGGWRYLEAAPIEAEFQARWSVHSTFVENTQEAIGSGKRNTQLIVEKFSQTSGEWDNAAQKVDDLEFNGVDDWFLPSKAELDQMYGNLKRRNLGDFKNERYWSSSQTTSWNSPWSQNFNDGSQNIGSCSSGLYVRPIRQVPGPNN
jgi:hypothetical protein